MLRWNMLAMTMVGVASLSSSVFAAELGAELTRPAAAISQLGPPVAKPQVVARSCPSDCQAQHDRCRVETKGSRTCDEARQACLQVCLQKKRK